MNDNKFWGAVVRPSSPCVFECNDDSVLVIRNVASAGDGAGSLYATAASCGGEAVLIGRLTESQPNLKIHATFFEDVKLHCSKGTEMHLTGFTSTAIDPTGCEDEEDDDDDEEDDDEDDEEERNKREAAIATSLGLQLRQKYEKLQQAVKNECAKMDAEGAEGKQSKSSSSKKEAEGKESKSSSSKEEAEGKQSKSSSSKKEAEGKESKSSSSKKDQAKGKKDKRAEDGEEEEAAPPPRKKDSKKRTAETQEEQPDEPQPPSKKQKKPKKLGALPGGGSYEVLEFGSGPTVKCGQRVTLRYEGRLASNGKKFDSGVFKFTQGLREAIAGFDEGVLGMMKGERRKIMVPSVLGYGRLGSPPLIPPNADLVFDISVLKIDR